MHTTNVDKNSCICKTVLKKSFVSPDINTSSHSIQKRV